jgi:hypothetical protein
MLNVYVSTLCNKNLVKDNMYCEDTASISDDWNNSVQEVLDSDPVIILIIFCCS